MKVFLVGLLQSSSRDHIARAVVMFLGLTFVVAEGWSNEQVRASEGMCLEEGFIGAYNDFYVTGLTTAGGALYATGAFRFIGGVTAPGIARWDGVDWQPLPAPGLFVAEVHEFKERTYAVGLFRESADVASFSLATLRDGAWHVVRGTRNSVIYNAAATADYLYVAGEFKRIGGVSAHGIARWDGVAWAALPPLPIDGYVLSLRALGDIVYALVDGPNSEPAFVFRFTKGDWSQVGPSIGPSASRLTISDRGDIYVVGVFDIVGQSGPFVTVAALQENAWQPLGPDPFYVDGDVLVVDDEVYVTGRFSSIGSLRCNGIARWDGASWHALGTGLVLDGVNLVYGGYALAYYAGEVFLGGAFYGVDNLPVQHLARWDGTAWRPVVRAGAKGFSGPVFVLLSTDAGLFAGGAFGLAGETTANGIARWDGEQWQPLGAGVDGYVSAMAWDGVDLYVGGRFRSAGGVIGNGVARWDGEQWQPLGNGLEDRAIVTTLAIHDGELYAGGQFGRNHEQTKIFRNVARWDGVEWQPLGDGWDYSIYSLASWEGSLFAAGYEEENANGDYSTLWYWDGAEWLRPGDKPHDGVSAIVPTENHLYASAARLPGGIEGVGRWNGTLWKEYPESDDDEFPLAMAYDEHLLYGVNVVPAEDYTIHLAVTDGSAWQLLGGPLHGNHDSSAPFPAPFHQSYVLARHEGRIFVGGMFTHVGVAESSAIAVWDQGRPCDATCGDANADGDITAGDALIALRAAVGLVDCQRVCDIDSSGATSTQDALGLLQYSLGLLVPLLC
ncbi:MAG TPA: hypothetical protein VEL28_22675 [Candidatus Binatia bacterium]|nr:hypothetical protein [Candidatus Binatia bacterium]